MLPDILYTTPTRSVGRFVEGQIYTFHRVRDRAYRDELTGAIQYFPHDKSVHLRMEGEFKVLTMAEIREMVRTI